MVSKVKKWTSASNVKEVTVPPMIWPLFVLNRNFSDISVEQITKGPINKLSVNCFNHFDLRLTSVKAISFFEQSIHKDASEAFITNVFIAMIFQRVVKVRLVAQNCSLLTWFVNVEVGVLHTETCSCVKVGWKGIKLFRSEVYVRWFLKAISSKSPLTFLMVK